MQFALKVKLCDLRLVLSVQRNFAYSTGFHGGHGSHGLPSLTSLTLQLKADTRFHPVRAPAGAYYGLDLFAPVVVWFGKRLELAADSCLLSRHDFGLSCVFGR